MTIRNHPYSEASHCISGSQPSRVGRSINSDSLSNKSDKAARLSKTDTIELSKQYTKPSLSQIRDGIVDELKQDKSSEYIDRLKQQVESGEYVVNSSELASLLLSDF